LILVAVRAGYKTKAAPFAIVDEEDYERASQRRWWSAVKNGETRAAAGIDGHSRLQMSKIHLGISDRCARASPP
jgi:hypothetical protein